MVLRTQVKMEEVLLDIVWNRTSRKNVTSGTLVTYALDLEGDNLPLGMSRKEAEILWHALSLLGVFLGI